MNVPLALTLWMLVPVSMPGALAQAVEAHARGATDRPTGDTREEGAHVDEAEEARAPLNPISPPPPPPPRSRVTAERLLGGRPAAASFGELQTFLLPGYEVVVWDASGHKTRGRVSAISSDRLLVFEEPFFLKYVRRPEEHILPKESIRRIDIVDPTTQGTLVGAAVGAGIMFGLVQATKNDEWTQGDLKGVGYAFLGILAFLPSMGLGSLVDWLHNSPIYEPRPHTPRVALIPTIGWHAIGASVYVRYLSQGRRHAISQAHMPPNRRMEPTRPCRTLPRAAHSRTLGF